MSLGTRAEKALESAEVTTVGDVMELLEKGEDAIMSIRNFGDKSMEELVQKMTEKGYLEGEDEEETEEEVEAE